MNLVPHLSGIGTGMPFAVVATRWGGGAGHLIQKQNYSQALVRAHVP